MVEQLITEHLDLWTSAHTTRSTSGRGSSNKLVLTGIKKLRELILELAVRGKLVPQSPGDAPAAVLLSEIKKEKEDLVKAKLIKKPKPLPAISGEDLPFLIPECWEWVRLQDVTTYIQRGKGPKYADSGSVRVVSQKCVQWSGFDTAPARFVTDESLGKYTAERFLKSHDLLWNSTGTGTVGRIVEISNIEEKSLVADSHVTVIRPLVVLGSFLTAYISAPGIQRRIEPESPNALVSGSTKQVELNTSSVNALEVPIPPLAEQTRIVAKVDELMALCDQLEKQTEDSISAHQTLVETLLATLTDSLDADELAQNWARLAEHFDTLFTTEHSIEQLKQTILQLAVMGKLTSRNAKDTSASELLANLNSRKLNFYAKKQLKKQKPLKKISETEIPFDLPDGWQWARIGDATLFSEYGISAKTFETKDGVPVLKMGDIQDGKVILGGQKKAALDFEGIDDLMLKNGDVLYNRTNSSELVGKTGLYAGPDEFYSFASYLIRIRCDENTVRPDFLNLNMNTPLFRATQINPHLKQQCGQANVNGTIMKSMLVAVAPIEEQGRIMEKVNELLTTCENLKKKLTVAQNRKAQLAAELVEQAVA